MFVAKLAEVDLVAHKLQLHYQDAQPHPPNLPVPTVPHPIVPREIQVAINFPVPSMQMMESYYYYFLTTSQGIALGIQLEASPKNHYTTWLIMSHATKLSLH